MVRADLRQPNLARLPPIQMVLLRLPQHLPPPHHQLRLQLGVRQPRRLRSRQPQQQLQRLPQRLAEPRFDSLLDLLGIRLHTGSFPCSGISTPRNIAGRSPQRTTTRSAEQLLTRHLTHPQKRCTPINPWISCVGWPGGISPPAPTERLMLIFT